MVEAPQHLIPGTLNPLSPSPLRQDLDGKAPDLAH